MKNLLYLALILIFEVTAFAQVSVKGYYRKNGTYVKPHQRTRPNNTITDNYSYKGNVNPFTGVVGTKSEENPSSHTFTPYAGAKTPEYNNSGQRVYNKTPVSYTAKTNTLSQFYTTYISSGTKERVFLEANKIVEVVGNTDNGFLLVKYDNVEGFIRKSEADSFSIAPPTEKAFFTPSPFSNIDTTKFKYAVTVTDLAFLRESAETKESNIILKLHYGTPIKVFRLQSDSFWIVKYKDKTGLMLDAFFKIVPETEIMDILRRKYRPKEANVSNKSKVDKPRKKFLGIF